MKIKFLKASNGDAIHIRFKDNDGDIRNILIDGGMPQTYYNSTDNINGELYETVNNLKENKEKIDLLVITHIDEDHIGGILKWFERESEAFKLINTVWFNSGKTIAKYFNEKENQELELTFKDTETSYTSVRQGKIFEDYIEKNKIWNKDIINDKRSLNDLGIELKILSPNNEKLKKLLKEYEKPKHGYYTSSKSNDWERDLQSFIEEESKSDFKFIRDKSVSNGSSIAFLLTIREKNFLFLGDAHADIIFNSLSNLGYSKENPLKVELLKVSHHGSSKNTNIELLEIIDTNNYIISTNSVSHNHPDKRTLSRIITRNPKASLYFNYSVVKDNIFSSNDYKSFGQFFAKNISEYKVEWE